MSSGNKFNLPEQEANLVPNFLTEYWQSREPLPSIRGVELWLYYLQRGFQTFYGLLGANMIAVLTIAVSLFLFAGVLLVLLNVDRVISEAGTSLSVSAYLKESTTNAERESLLRELRENKSIRSVTFISKEQALELFRKDLGARSSFLDGLDQDNPLPASVDLLLHPDELKVGSVDAFVGRLRENPVIEEVVYGSEWVRRMQGVIRVFRVFSFVLLGIVLCVIMFLISNTIKLVLFSRRDEIAIMQLVGARDADVRSPFVICGALQGIVGGVLALGLAHIAFTLLDFELRSSTIVGVALPSLEFLPVWLAFGIFLFAVLIGTFGSKLAVRKFMDV